MKEEGLRSPHATLASLGLQGIAATYWNLPPETLIKKTLDLKQGMLADTGALVVDTGAFTGRSPKDRFIVCDEKTKETVWWGEVNIKLAPEKFDHLYERLTQYLEGKEVYVRDAYACAEPAYRLNLCVVTELPWQNLFAYDLFLRPSEKEILAAKEPDWHIIAVPGFAADPKTDGTRQGNFTVINFTKRLILVGGSAYAGEIKKAVFSVLHYLLPLEKGVLSLHSSANIGKDDDTALFFGLSGTGKTTLSADPNRRLIGDDEHGWADHSVFNFEGGCYAKCVNLSKEREPRIWNAIVSGAVVENVKFFDGTTAINYDDTSKTENTRVAYPITFIENAAVPSIGSLPKNIIFLVCDAYGILPPISKLNHGQAMYYFLSGYTAKVAGTEVGVVEPQATFSACFGKAFLTLHPTTYAKLLGKKLEEHPDIRVWLVNTGWSGGPYGVGKRISLPLTRAIVSAALDGVLNDVPYQTLPVFDLEIPTNCPGVPSEILNPRTLWSDSALYDAKARELATRFRENFMQYADFADKEISAAAPKSE